MQNAGPPRVRENAMCFRGLFPTSQLNGHSAHKLRFAQDMALHGMFEVWLGGSGFQVELCVERIQSEIVAVWRAPRRTWTSIADLAKVVSSLQRSSGELFLFVYSLGQSPRVCREVV